LLLSNWGLQPLSDDTRLALLQILEDRYVQKATVVASQLPVDKWHAYINQPTLADGICDRLSANEIRIELRGQSLRKKIIWLVILFLYICTNIFNMDKTGTLSSGMPGTLSSGMPGTLSPKSPLMLLG